MVASRRFATASDTANGGQQRLDNHVKIVEVGPRDGLQNEKKTIPLATKIELIERLAKAGLTTIEAGAFVSPKWVPQMSNSSEILEHLLQHGTPSRAPLTFSFLAPNTKGLDSAIAILSRYPKAFTRESQRTPPSKDSPGTQKPALEIAIFAAATESFSHRNLNCSIADSLTRFSAVIAAAKDADLRVRAYISVVLGCPFEGPAVDPHRVAALATELLGMGADSISLGDTTGMGTAPRTAELLTCLHNAGVRVGEDVAMHFHDTYGQALVNTAVALEHGVREFDSSVGGLGGCPYSPGASGNVATEDVVYFLESLGMDTGVDLDAVAEVGAWITGEVGKPHGGSVGKALLAARARGRAEREGSGNVG